MKYFLLLMAVFLANCGGVIGRGSVANKFVEPGAEESILQNAPKTITAELLGFQHVPTTDILVMKQLYPKYMWRGTVTFLDIPYIKNGESIGNVYFYGRKNAKIAAYRYAALHKKKYRDKFIGKKFFILDVQSFSDLKLGCLPGTPSMLGGMLPFVGASASDKASGDAWFTCTGKLRITGFIGFPLP